MIEFTVLGRPATAGSKRAIPYRKKGQFTKNGREALGVSVIHDNQRFEPWSRECKAAAIASAGGAFITGPILLVVRVVRPRPKGHYRTGKHAAELRNGVPDYPDTTPDLTKVVRAVEDSLTGVIWRDDCQVVRQVTAKDWGTPERVEITVATFPAADDDAVDSAREIAGIVELKSEKG